MAYVRPPNTFLTTGVLIQSPGPLPLEPAGLLPVTLDVKIASKNNLGVVQVGDNINVTPEGIISVDIEDNCCCNVKLVKDNYTASEKDYYIGVNSSGPTTIYLPSNPKDCIELVIKADMPAPIGNRKVTIKPQGTTIDGQSQIILTVPYEVIRVISQGGSWHKI